MNDDDDNKEKERRQRQANEIGRARVTGIISDGRDTFIATELSWPVATTAAVVMVTLAIARSSPVVSVSPNVSTTLLNTSAGWLASAQVKRIQMAFALIASPARPRPRHPTRLD